MLKKTDLRSGKVAGSAWRPLLWLVLCTSVALGFACRRSEASWAVQSTDPLPVGNNPYCLSVADFNCDGALDLAIPSSDDMNVDVMLGDGRGGFKESQGSPIAVGRNPRTAVAGDFNRDGKLDLAVANAHDNNVTVLLGDGTGRFKKAQGSPFPTGTYPRSIATGDFNRDGNLDLAIANSCDGAVTILLGNGTGGFTPAPGSPFPVRQSPRCITVGDFNGDGIPDLATANAYSNTVSVLLGEGKGGFTQALGSPIPVGKFPRSLAVGDFNRDGKQDIAVANEKSDTISILLGNGAGVFMAAPESPFLVGTWFKPWSRGIRPYCVTVWDFDGDGNQDLAISSASELVTVMLCDGKGRFSEAPDSPFRVGSLPKWMSVGDFNKDGRPDLAIVSRNDGNVKVLLNHFKVGQSK